ncbi:MAG: hypothetical protein KA318_00165 [Nitrosomonas sp.]|nr:hypothetical protein [Nitrosomonas sp.]
MTEAEILLNKHCGECWQEFETELGCEENQEYRRGFKAGALFKALEIRDQLKEIERKND